MKLDDGAIASIDITGAMETRRWATASSARSAGSRAPVGAGCSSGDFRGIVRRAQAQNYGAPSLDDRRSSRRLLPRLRAERRREPRVRPQHGRRRESVSPAADRRARRRRRIGAAVHLQPADARLPARMCCGRAAARRSTGSRRSSASSGSSRKRRSASSSSTARSRSTSRSCSRDWLAAMRAAHPKARLTVAAHDYFAVCPSFVLLNADGRYCGIPDVSECATCLPRHRASYVALSPPTEIGPWRALVGALPRGGGRGALLLRVDAAACCSAPTRTLDAGPHQRRPASRRLRAGALARARSCRAARRSASSARSASRRARSS